MKLVIVEELLKETRLRVLVQLRANRCSSGELRASLADLVDLYLLAYVVAIWTVHHSVRGGRWLSFAANFTEVERNHFSLLVVPSLIQILLVRVLHFSVRIGRLDSDLDLSIFMVDLL